MMWLARLAAWSLALLGLIGWIADIDWPWWLLVGLGTPLGILFLVDEATGGLFTGSNGDGGGSDGGVVIDGGGGGEGGVGGG